MKRYHLNDRACSLRFLITTVIDTIAIRANAKKKVVVLMPGNLSFSGSLKEVYYKPSQKSFL